MRGKKALRFKPVINSARAHGPNRHRHKRRPESGGPGFWNRAPGDIGQYRQGRHVRIFALVRRHALGGIALHMLD